MAIALAGQSRTASSTRVASSLPGALLPDDDETVLVILIEDLGRHASALTGADTHISVDEHSYLHVVAHCLVTVYHSTGSRRG